MTTCTLPSVKHRLPVHLIHLSTAYLYASFIQALPTCAPPTVKQRLPVHLLQPNTIYPCTPPSVKHHLPVRLLQSFQGQYQQLGVVLVGQRWEGDRGETPALQPVHHGGVNGHSFLGGDVWSILKHKPSALQINW